MAAPRLEIDLDKLRHNARSLVDRLAGRGISVTGVTKAILGSPEIADVLLRAGCRGLGDSRIENIEALRRAQVAAPMTLIRSPMLSQVDRVVEHADVSFNTELDVVAALSAAAGLSGRTHGVVLMVELGDLREGILPGDLQVTVEAVLRFPNIALLGIGANLACQSGVAPDGRNMAELSGLASSVEAAFGLHLDIVSGGNSASLGWALGAADVGRVNDLRLGESILLGRETLHRQPITGLHTDAIALVAEVIESKSKPSQLWGELGQTAFGEKARAADDGDHWRTIVAVGHQDADPSGVSAPAGMEVLGASSDHLILATGRQVPIGDEIELQLNYSALVRATSSPFVIRKFGQDHGGTRPRS